ncbi:MAG TPA: hypothetical protein VFP21_02070 [Solirubrobacterales bacterium]|nr:hypothetical protein [Solirubrobacterales bacterium]
MQLSDLREQMQSRLSVFLWDQWGQLGIQVPVTRQDHWAADPEALVLLSLEVGRDEPRLIDEVLDWLVVNERLISVQRLRNLIIDEEDRALVEGTIGWLAGQRRRARLTPKGAEEAPLRRQSFYRRLNHVTAEPDPAFLAQGLLKPPVEPRLHSQPPDLGAPIAFAFRLRALLGFGARAEAMRVILTIDAPWMSVQAVAASTAYTKRNIQEALGQLRAAGALSSSVLGNEQRFQAPRQRWADFLALDEFPAHRDWPQLFAAYRHLLRWVVAHETAGLSPYMLASEARTLAEELSDDLRFAGVPFDASGPSGEDYWDAISEQLLRVMPAT